MATDAPRGSIRVRGAGWIMGRMGGIAKNLGGAFRREVMCHALAFVFGLMVVLPFLVLLTDRRLVVDISNIRVQPDPVIPGQPMRIYWDVVEHRNCPGMVHRVIVDASGRQYSFRAESTVYHHALNKDVRRVSREFTAPTSLTENSVAEHRVTVERWCNFVQEMFLPMREISAVKFNVGSRQRQ